MGGRRPRCCASAAAEDASALAAGPPKGVEEEDDDAAKEGLGTEAAPEEPKGRLSPESGVPEKSDESPCPSPLESKNDGKMEDPDG